MPPAILADAPPFNIPKHVTSVDVVTATVGPEISFTNPLAFVIHPLASVTTKLYAPAGILLLHNVVGPLLHW